MPGQVTDWDDLRYVLAVARGGNLSAAARHLGINLRVLVNADDELDESFVTAQKPAAMNVFNADHLRPAHAAMGREAVEAAFTSVKQPAPPNVP